MIVQCEHCHTKYRIADEKVKGKGVKVRCAKCENVFTVTPPKEDIQPTAAVPSSPSVPKDEPVPSQASGMIEGPAPPIAKPPAPEPTPTPAPPVTRSYMPGMFSLHRTRPSMRSAKILQCCTRHDPSASWTVRWSSGGKGDQKNDAAYRSRSRVPRM